MLKTTAVAAAVVAQKQMALRAVMHSQIMALYKLVRSCLGLVFKVDYWTSGNSNTTNNNIDKNSSSGGGHRCRRGKERRLYMTMAVAATAVAHTRSIPLSRCEVVSWKKGIHILVLVCKTYFEIILFFLEFNVEGRQRAGAATTTTAYQIAENSSSSGRHRRKAAYNSNNANDR